MTDQDLFAFMDIFRTITRVYPLRGEEHEKQDIGRAYFKAMRRFTLDQVRFGAENCIEHLQRFPKPVEWIKQIPRQRVAQDDIAQLTTLELSEYRDAESKHWEGDPCGCPSCREVGVEHRLIRFVPNQPEERVRIDENRTSVRGHWAHGNELKRWYAAKDKFWAQFTDALGNKTLGGMLQKKEKIPFDQRIEDIFKKRPKTSRQIEQSVTSD